MDIGGSRCDERCHWLPAATDHGCRSTLGLWSWEETFPRHELKCHLMSCMYETLSSPFPGSPLVPSIVFPIISLLLPIHVVIATRSCPALLNLCQVTYKAGAAVPKAADVPKWVMPTEMYSARPSTVLAYKKAHQVGRFDPAASEILEQKITQMWKEIEERGSLDFPCSHYVFLFAFPFRSTRSPKRQPMHIALPSPPLITSLHELSPMLLQPSKNSHLEALCQHPKCGRRLRAVRWIPHAATMLKISDSELCCPFSFFIPDSPDFPI